MSDEPDRDASDVLVLPGRLDAAWRSFTATLDAVFPASDWPNERLLAFRQEFLDNASRAAFTGSWFEQQGQPVEATKSYASAAEKRVHATEIGVLLATRGADVGEGDVYDMLRTFD